MKEDYYNNDDRQYLSMMKDTIERMSNNSSNCKAWMVGIVTGFLAISSHISELNWWILLGILPVLVFWHLDAYYLHLERALRNRQKVFINCLLSEDDSHSLLYDFSPYFIDKEDADTQNQGLKKTKWMFLNKSVWPLYTVILAVIVVVTVIVNIPLTRQLLLGGGALNSVF